MVLRLHWSRCLVFMLNVGGTRICVQTVFYWYFVCFHQAITTGVATPRKSPLKALVPILTPRPFLLAVKASNQA